VSVLAALARSHSQLSVMDPPPGPSQLSVSTGSSLSLPSELIPCELYCLLAGISASFRTQPGRSALSNTALQPANSRAKTPCEIEEACSRGSRLNAKRYPDKTFTVTRRRCCMRNRSRSAARAAFMFLSVCGSAEARSRYPYLVEATDRMLALNAVAGRATSREAAAAAKQVTRSRYSQTTSNRAPETGNRFAAIRQFTVGSQRERRRGGSIHWHT
jgi:hypothetical protein